MENLSKKDAFLEKYISNGVNNNTEDFFEEFINIFKNDLQDFLLIIQHPLFYKSFLQYISMLGISLEEKTDNNTIFKEMMKYIIFSAKEEKIWDPVFSFSHQGNKFIIISV
jgi:hypothetical protein